SAYSWLHTTSSGNGSGTVSFTVDANSSTSSRSGTITADSQTFTVTQAGITCSYSLFPSAASCSSSSTTSSFNVTSPSGCSWTAVSSASWLTINSGSTGSGSGNVTYALAANSSSSSRSSTVTVAGQVLTVTQNGHLFPIANPGGNQANGVGSAIAFNGSGSYANDGATLTSFNWNFGDLTSASGSLVSPPYAVAGAYA